MPALPSHQDLFRPLLEHLKSIHPNTAKWDKLTEVMAIELKMTSEQLSEMIPSGVRTSFKDRVGWALTYLNKAGLTEKPTRGENRITDLGLSVLKEYEGTINVAYLKRFDTFLKFVSIGSSEESVNESSMPNDEKSSMDVVPTQEILKQLRIHNNQLASELKAKILENSPQFFEQLVVDLMVKMGYGGTHQEAAKALGRSGDGGVDGVIREDRLGLSSIYLQAKRYQDTKIGRPDLQKFASAVSDHDATKGVFITTSSFSQDARDYKNKHVNITLIDGDELVKLMLEFGLGVSTELTVHLQKIDEDYWL